MKLLKELTTVTSFSKSLAMILFVTLPILGFYLGIQYQRSLLEYTNVAYYPANRNNSYAVSGEHCGGNSRIAKQCVAGYHCAPSGSSRIPFGDVGGICIKDGVTPTPIPQKNGLQIHN